MVGEEKRVKGDPTGLPVRGYLYGGLLNEFCKRLKVGNTCCSRTLFQKELGREFFVSCCYAYSEAERRREEEVYCMKDAYLYVVCDL